MLWYGNLVWFKQYENHAHHASLYVCIVETEKTDFSIKMMKLFTLNQRYTHTRQFVRIHMYVWMDVYQFVVLYVNRVVCIKNCLLHQLGIISVYYIWIYCIKVRSGQSWRNGTKCDSKIGWLWVWSSLEEMKYLFKFILSILCPGVEAKRGVEFRRSKCNASRIRRKVGNGVS